MECPPPSGPAAPRSARAAAATLLVAIAVLGVVTLPGYPYSGDNYVPRAEAIHLLQTGRLGFSYAERPLLKGLDSERGQYFFENAATETLHSKYGLMYTLLYLPPVAVERAISGPLAPMHMDRSMLLVVGLYGVAFAIGVAFYLFRIARLYDPEPWRCAAFVAAAIFPSFVWHYLRAPALEVFQLFFFTALCANFLSFLRRVREAQRWTRAAVLELAAATWCAGALVLMRPSFLVLFPVIGVSALLAAPGSGGLGTRVRRGAVGLSSGVLIPAALSLAAWLAVNAFRTGSPLDTAYAQWVRGGEVMSRVTLSVAPAALSAFLLEPGNYNVFLHQPLLAIAIAGWPAFVRARGREGISLLALSAASAAIVLVVTNWNGEWCYGPRYLVHPLLVLCIPALTLARRLGSATKGARGASAAAVGIVLTLGLTAQLRVDSLHYFVFHQTEGWFRAQTAHPGMQAYFEEPRHRALYVERLVRFVEDDAPFEPAAILVESVPESRRAQVRQALREFLRPAVAPNFWLAGPPEPR